MARGINASFLGPGLPFIMIIAEVMGVMVIILICSLCIKQIKLAVLVG